MHLVLNHHEISPDLKIRCLQVAECYRRVFDGEAVVSVAMSIGRASALAQALAEPGGNAAAQSILTYLVPELERNGTDFWGTPLGRACGWWTGAGQLDYSGGGLQVVTPQPRVPLLLGMTRQSAFEMVTRGRLRKLSPAGVASEDVRREMQARYPL